MDGQFDGLRANLAEMGMTLNSSANDEHVPEVERHIRTLKERVRSVYNMLPFAKMPARMIIELVYYCGFWLNSFPAHGGISPTLSPRTIIAGMTIDYNHHCKLEFGTYAQVHEEHDNSMTARTVGAIALRPTGNHQGGHFFFSLSTGRVLNRSHWTVLPMPTDVIDRVHKMSRRDETEVTLYFATKRGQIEDEMHDDVDDDTFDPANNDNTDEDDDDNNGGGGENGSDGNSGCSGGIYIDERRWQQQNRQQRWR